MDNGRCYQHGGRNEDDDRDPGGAPEQNDNAVGNSGGSPPDGNDNAQRHSLHADRGIFYDRLPDEKQATVDELEAALIERYKEYQGREPDRADAKDMFEIAVGYVQRDYAREYLVDQMEDSDNLLLEHIEMEGEDGEPIEFDKPNEIIDKISDIQREDRLSRRDKGLEKDPESEKADEVGNLADAWRTALSE